MLESQSNSLFTHPTITTHSQTLSYTHATLALTSVEGLSFELILTLAPANTHPVYRKEEHVSSFKPLFFILCTVIFIQNVPITDKVEKVIVIQIFLWGTGYLLKKCWAALFIIFKERITGGESSLFHNWIPHWCHTM